MAEDPDPSQMLESFIKHVQVLAADSSYQFLKGILDDNEDLKDRNNNLNITNDQNLKTLGRLQQQLEEETKRVEEQVSEIEKLVNDNTDLNGRVELLEQDAETTKAQLDQNAEDIASLRTSLGEATGELEETKTDLEKTREENSQLQADVNFRDSEIQGLMTSLEEERSSLAATRALEEQARTELQFVKDELEAKKTRLNELAALTFKMKNPPQDTTRQQLNTIYNAVYKWAEEVFSDDLEDTIFHSSSAPSWNKLKNHGRVNRIIPLPLSNTPEAKQMRIAAVMAVVAWSFAQYIFQPTYLLQCNELSDLLAGLADDDPVRENYLRSVLLPIHPSKQKTNGKKRIEQAVADVFACVSPVLPELKKEVFRSSLEKMCKQVCGQWMRLQLLDEKIEPCFDAYDEEDWKLQPLPALDDSKGDSHASSSGYQDTSTESAVTDEQGLHDLEDIAAVLWPSFLSFRGGESELLTEGFVLNKGQTKAAYSEEKAALLQGIHRAARQITRKDRTKSFATTGGERTPLKQGFLLPDGLDDLPPAVGDLDLTSGEALPPRDGDWPPVNGDSHSETEHPLPSPLLADGEQQQQQEAEEAEQVEEAETVEATDVDTEAEPESWEDAEEARTEKGEDEEQENLEQQQEEEEEEQGAVVVEEEERDKDKEEEELGSETSATEKGEDPEHEAEYSPEGSEVEGEGEPSGASLDPEDPPPETDDVPPEATEEKPHQEEGEGENDGEAENPPPQSPLEEEQAEEAAAPEGAETGEEETAHQEETAD
ncbi:hypothetical protein BX600DRAFT_505395 [Xylariales sp. PMI_506]|nr:hypothetical protein BX600DRAFT_505395 [Xylariales sp. PMI_506]